jgi:hypothetical protein
VPDQVRERFAGACDPGHVEALGNFERCQFSILDDEVGRTVGRVDRIVAIAIDAFNLNIQISDAVLNVASRVLASDVVKPASARKLRTTHSD